MKLELVTNVCGLSLQSNILMLQGPILTGMPGLDLITQIKVRPSLPSQLQ